MLVKFAREPEPRNRKSMTKPATTAACLALVSPQPFATLGLAVHRDGGMIRAGFGRHPSLLFHYLADRPRNRSSFTRHLDLIRPYPNRCRSA